MKRIKLGIIGFGNMSRAILSGLLKRFNGELDIAVSDVTPPDLKEFAGARAVQTNAEAVEGADFVLLAVKPQSVAEAVSGLDFGDCVVISILAGVKANTLMRLCKTKKVVRVMPNLNASVGKSVNSYACFGLNAKEEEFILAFLNSFGCSVKMDEKMINAATGLAGSGPAFVFMFIKALIDSAKARAFSDDEALLLAVETLKGSADKLASLGSGADIDKLVGAVCSKGGTTIEGVNHLHECGFEEIIKTAVDKAIKRADELSDN